MRLRWKLTLSYTLVTAGAILLIEAGLLTVAVFLLTRADTLGSILFPVLQEATADLVPALTRQPPDRDALQAWVTELVQTGDLPRRSGSSLHLNLEPAALEWAVLLDARGRPLAAYPPEQCNHEGPAACWETETEALVQRALNGERRSERLVRRSAEGLDLAIPIWGAQRQLAGVLVLHIAWPTSLREWPREILRTLLPSAAVVTLFAALVGTVFGFFTARGLTRRLAALAQAADAWSQGDFSVQVRDHAPDELGSLARRLNQMAEQLENLLHARQELAALEERNRLARELHDAVKQQVFAAGMQLAAARRYLPHDLPRAQSALGQAEALLQQAQQELTALLRELRPAALQGRGLVAALREYLQEWSQRTGIEADLQVQGQRRLPLEIEQALWRIVQEALANVARHSQARRVQIRLAWEAESIRLSVSDDGRGFVPTAGRGRGLGLTSMAERARGLGGEFHLRSAPGQGTQVTVVLPLAAARPRPPHAATHSTRGSGRSGQSADG